jgi:hypothetical protein
MYNRAAKEIVATQRVHLAAVRPWRLAVIGILRCTVGVAALARPVDTIRFASVDQVTAQRTAWVARLAGARDLAIGAGMLDAMLRRQPTSGWLAVGAISDAMDAMIIAAATVRGQLAILPGTVMTASAVGGVLAAAPISLGQGRQPGEPVPTRHSPAQRSDVATT